MGDPVRLPLPVRGELNTTDPTSAMPAGSLIEATDLSHRALGPRPGRSRSATAQGLTGIGRSVYEFDGVDDFLLFNYTAEQMVLGVEWTLDILFEPSAVGVDSGTLFVLGTSAHRDIWVYLDGSGAAGANPRTVRAQVSPSTVGVSSGTTASVQNTTQRTLASIGNPATDPTLIYHARLVRSMVNNNAADTVVTLYVNGASSQANLSTSMGHAYGTSGGIYLGSKYNDAGDFYGGWIYKTLLRNGVFTDLQDGWQGITPTLCKNVLFCASGGPASQWVGSTSCADELSRFRNYGAEFGTPLTDSLTAWPGVFPVNAIEHYTDQTGRNFNLVEAGGRLFWERVT